MQSNKYIFALTKIKSLYVTLRNNPSTSILIDRFFSISGTVCKKNAATKGNKLILPRSILKANIKLINHHSTTIFKITQT